MDRNTGRIGVQTTGFSIVLPVFSSVKKIRQQQTPAWRVNRYSGRVGIWIPAPPLKAPCHVDRSIGVFPMRSGDTPLVLGSILNNASFH